MSDLEDLVAGADPPAAAPAAAPEKKPSALDDLVSKVQTEPSKELLGQLGDIKQREMGETQRAESLASQRRQKDQQQWEQAFDAKAANVNDMPPKWDADGQMEKYSTDPVSAFGSFASVFAIAAAAFTKLPMENALNGSAAAMNAIQAKDEKAYQKAYQAWKDNTDLVVKRGTMMQQDYDNAIRKGAANATVAQAEKLAVAAKYGDERYMALLQGGFAPEAEELLQTRNKTLLGIINAAVHMEQQHESILQRREAAKFQHEDRQAQIKQRESDSLQRSEDKAATLKRQEQADEDRRADREERNRLTADRDRERAELGNKKQAEVERRNRERALAKTGDPKAVHGEVIRGLASDDPVEREQAERKFEALKKVQAVTGKGTSSGVVTMNRNDAQEVIRRQNEKIENGMDATQAFNEARQEVAAAGKAPSSLERRQSEVREKATVVLDDAIASVEAQMSGGKKVTNLKGEANRWLEWGLPILGKKNVGTEATDFKQYAQLLETLVPQSIGARSQISKEERANMKEIVGGLSRFQADDAALKKLKYLRDLINRPDKAENEGAPKDKATAPKLPEKTEREHGKTYKVNDESHIWNKTDGKWYTPDEWKELKEWEASKKKEWEAR